MDSNTASTKIQAVYRGFKCRKLLAHCKKVAQILQCKGFTM